MALFGKKEKKMVACAICGEEAKTGLFRGLFQKQIEGQYVCDSCYGEADLPAGAVNHMTIADFRGYMAFREENRKLKDIFQTTLEVDFGAFEEKFVFDTIHRLMCMNKNLQTTVFEAKHIRSFTIKEDERVIFSGGPNGLNSYESSVPEQIRALKHQIMMFNMQKQRFEQELVRMNEEQRQQARSRAPRFTMGNLFQKFYVEIHLEHPYWNVLTAELSAPHMNTQEPDAFDYMNRYNTCITHMENLANALMELAFPRAAQAAYAPAAAPAQNVRSTASADAIAELKSYKELLDMGIITQAEFDSKKRQLLGM